MSIVKQARELFVRTQYYIDLKTSEDRVGPGGVFISTARTRNWAISAAGTYKVPKNYKAFHIAEAKLEKATHVVLMDLEKKNMWVMTTEEFKARSKKNSANAYSFNVLNKGLAADYRSNYHTQEEIADSLQSMKKARI